jgi:CHAT domain-containing protein/Tfp pilus assembly protein PilF
VLPHRRWLLPLLLLLCALPLCAQQPTWEQLSDQVRDLYTHGRYEEAIPIAQQALAAVEAKLGPDDPQVASCLNNLALLYMETGQYPQAEPLYLRALRLVELGAGPDEPITAVALGNLADLYDEEGRFAEAEPLLLRALHIKEAALGPDDPTVAIALNNLAEHYRRQGRYTEAEPLYLRALAIKQKVLGPDHPSLATSLNNLAALYSSVGRDSEAEPLYRRALAIDEKALGPEHPHVASDLNNLALLYANEGRAGEAEPLFRRSLAIVEKVLGPDHPEVAMALNNLGLAASALGREAEAESLFQRALQIDEKALGPDHPNLLTDLANLSATRLARGDAHATQALFTRFLDLLFRRFQYSFTYMGEKERLQFLQTVEINFPVYFSFCTMYADQMPELRASLYDTLLWEKGFVGQSVAALRSRIAAGGDRESLAMLDQLTDLKQQLAALLNQPGPDRAAWLKQVAALQAQADQLEQQLVRRSSSLQEEKKLERVTWRDVQKALRPGEAAVEVVKFQLYQPRHWTDTFRYVALIVTPETRDAPQLVILGDSPALEGAPLIEFQQDVQQRGSEPAAETRPIQPGARAYDLFWKPLAPFLAGRTRVYLSPDGVLNQVPLGLLPTPGGRLLMEQVDLRLLSSTKDLLRPAPPAAGAQAVLVGDPAFLLTEEQQRAALRRLEKAEAQPVVMAAAASPGDSGWRSRDLASRGACRPAPPQGGVLCPLPGTGAELHSVASLLQARDWQVTLYQGADALEEAVKSVHHPRLLHLATHGFFLSDQQVKQQERFRGGERPAEMEDPMLRSGLLFAGADRSYRHDPPASGLDDGVLTAYEASALDLQGTELVVLSACETGLGQVQAGEGVFGLRRALQIAGADAVLMTLWSVPDRETQELMTGFYRDWLGGMEKHEALRRAQLEERALVRKRYGQDLPYYWGAFVLVGR